MRLHNHWHRCLEPSILECLFRVVYTYTLIVGDLVFFMVFCSGLAISTQ